MTTASVAMKKATAYVRVSSDNDEQLSSYKAQIDYYTSHNKSNSAWTFVGVYTDENINFVFTDDMELVFSI